MPFDGTPFKWIDFFETVLLWTCWGYLVVCCYYLYWKEKKGGLGLAFVMGLFPGVVLEGIQIFIASRFCNVNDVIGNWVGTMAGILFFLVVRLFLQPDRRSEIRLYTPIVCVYFLYVLYAGLNPFDFSFSMAAMVSNPDLSRLVPFFAYFAHTDIWDIEDLVRTLIQFVPISLLLSMYMIKKNVNKKWIFTATGGAGFIVGSFIELFQLFSPTRSADLTDILLFCAGGLSGTFLYHYCANNPGRPLYGLPPSHGNP